MWMQRSKIIEQGAAKAVRRFLCALSAHHLDAGIRAVGGSIVYTSVLQALRNGRKTRYCTPGRGHLAKVAGVSLATISSYTNRLQKDLIIEKIQRRPVKGMWSTNMYRLGVAILGIVEAVTIEYLKILNRVKKALYIVSKSPIIKLSEEKKAVSNPSSPSPPLPDYIQRLSAKYGFSLKTA